MKYIVCLILAVLTFAVAYTSDTGISFSHKSGLSSICINGKCKTDENRGFVSLECKDGKCKKEYSNTVCHDGKCTHTENPESQENIPKPNFPDILDGFNFLNFGGMGGPFEECKDGQINNMFYVKLFNTCYKTICVNGLWKDKTVHGPCYEG
ncbi:unnamed protein product [Mytilus coruscus]|uniref:Uncharacterized protein n=1 Tax=Mytilus coruscus TaxID=42192 RepID=A0A6J8A0J5_MYTCO|nr:unnamed protein product [Mytilus coruscus]